MNESIFNLINKKSKLKKILCRQPLYEKIITFIFYGIYRSKGV